MRKFYVTTSLCSLMLVALMLIPSPASALLTYINPVGGGDGSEPSLIDPGGVLDTLYGLSNLARVDDGFDQFWHVTASGAATAQAKFARFSESLYAGSQFLFTVPGTSNGYLSGSPSAIITEVGSFRFYDDPYDPITGFDPPKWSSVPGDNPAFSQQPAGLDRMVTWVYKTNGHYVIAWEDLNDLDYNDIVFELSGVSVIPEPSSMLLLGMGILGLYGIGRRKIKA